MEISSHHEEEDGEIPMPISTSFMGIHTHVHAHAHAHAHAHHGHIQHGHITYHPYHHYHNTSTSLPSNNNSNNGGTSCAITTTNATLMEDDLHHKSNGNNHDDNDDDDDDDDDYHDGLGSKTKKEMMIIRYKECQKNHAASMGGNATDGCGEFMPSGEEGTLESLTCLACNCHRNFHRKEIQGDEKCHFNPSTPHHHLLNTRGRNVILGNSPNFVGPLVPYSRSLTITMPSTYTHTNQSHHNHHGNNNGGGLMNTMVRPNHDYHNNQVVKKRFRTKFSQEQKEKMLEFAEKVGWKIQKLEESVVQQFCAEVGVKRRVLKVWMHNNKYNLAKKNYNIIDNDNNIINDNISC